MPRLLITLGDPAGVGPEVTAKALAQLAAQRPSGSGWLVLGNGTAFREAIDALPTEPATRLREATAWRERPAGQALDAGGLDDAAAAEAAPVVAADLDGGAHIAPGAPSAASGASAARAVEAALAIIRQRAIRRADGAVASGLVTAPLSKSALRLAGAPHLDHTTWLGAAAGRDTIMSFVGGGLRVALATVHIALRDVPERLAVEPLATLIVRAGTALARFEGLAQPVRVAVCGVNPHAGEGGLFGDEEGRIVAPAIERARAGLPAGDPLLADGLPVALDISGPWPADTVFHRAREGAFDVVVAMYHDQALCAVKTVAFHDAVNATLNLPFVRTSPDHGTAYDLAGRWCADARSMLAALRLAQRWCAKGMAGGAPAP